MLVGVLLTLLKVVMFVVYVSSSPLHAIVALFCVRVSCLPSCVLDNCFYDVNYYCLLSLNLNNFTITH